MRLFPLLFLTIFSFAYASDDPLLPEGPDETIPEEQIEETEPLFSGFAETRAGLRLQNDKYEKEFSIGEARLQLEFSREFEPISIEAIADFIFDPVMDCYSLNLLRGKGLLDLRAANLMFSPVSFADVKIGRQILTWGTGDLLFINDMFPKDWQSFFIGRDMEYLKAPSDSAKVSFFTEFFDLDFIYSPRFNPDRFIRGERLSYWNGTRKAGRSSILDEKRRNNFFRDDEFFARIYKNIEGYEVAFYGYVGYWKSPGGFDPIAKKAVFPKLSVYGASLRGQVFSGIGNVEVGYYDSRQDRKGSNPFINNSQYRFLIGYERDLSDLLKDFSIGVQYYLERTLHFDRIPTSMRQTKKHRHLFTLRATLLMLNQNLTLSLFTYYSPTDEDVYLRPKVQYKIDDNWTAEVGGNLFFGRHPYTFFGQFADNTNAYASIRCGF